MSKKLKTLLLSTILLAVGAFSMEVMDEQVQEYQEDEELNEFGVTNSQFKYTINLYCIYNHRGNWDFLIALMLQIPKNKRHDALNEFEYRVGKLGDKIYLERYQVPSQYTVTDSPYKPKNSKSLREFLLNIEN